MSELQEILARRRRWEEEEEEAKARSTDTLRQRSPASNSPLSFAPAPKIVIQKQVLPKPVPTTTRPSSLPTKTTTTTAAPLANGLRPVSARTNPLPKPTSFSSKTPSVTTTQVPPPIPSKPALLRAVPPAKPAHRPLVPAHPPPPPPPPSSSSIQQTAPVGLPRTSGLRPDSWIKANGKNDETNVSMRDLFRRSTSGSELDPPAGLQRQNNKGGEAAATTTSPQTASPASSWDLRSGSKPLVAEQPKTGSNRTLLVRQGSASATDSGVRPVAPTMSAPMRRNAVISNTTTAPTTARVQQQQPPQRSFKLPPQAAAKPPGSPLQTPLPAEETQQQQQQRAPQRHVTSQEFAQSLAVMEDLRAPLTAFYETHNRLKLGSVDKILASFGMRGREQGELQLNQALQREYGADLTTSGGGGNLITFARALYRFTGLQDGDLAFEPGQIIQVTDSSKDWWLGSYKVGDKTLSGVFPKNYVQDVSEDVALETLAKQENKPLQQQQAQQRPVQPQQQPQQQARSEEYSPENVKEDIVASHYFKAVLEVVTSEFKYVVDLFIVNAVFVTQLQANASKSHYASELFPSWISIVYAHENILGRLMEALPQVSVIQSSFPKRETVGAEQRKPLSQPLGESLIKLVCGDSAAKLYAFQQRLEELEEAHNLYLESGKAMTSEQRQLRTELISDWVSRQSKELGNLIPFLKMSNQFILQYHSTLKKLEQFTGEDLAFINKLEEHPAMKSMKLRDFLIKPIQRVCKYPLLYREIIKYAPEEETRQVAKATQDKFMLITEHVNLMIKQSELGNAKRLAELLICVYPSTDLQRFDLHLPHTLLTLHREGDLTIAALPSADTLAAEIPTFPSKNLTGLLITDSLFFCEKQSVMRLLAKPEQRVRLHHVLRFSSAQFERVAVEPVDEDVIALTLFTVMSKEQRWVLKFPSRVVRDGWVEDLNASVERSEASRERERAAHKQEQRISQQRSSVRNSKQLPEPPRRKGVLMSLMDELKYVQVLKGVSKDEV